MLKTFDCTEDGEMKEYVGWKMVHSQAERSLKMMQPVLMQSFTDKVMIPGGHHLVTQSILGSILMICDPKKKLT